LIFALTTPIDDARHAKRGTNFDRVEADVDRYNAAATEVCRAAGVPMHDLHQVAVLGGTAKMLGKDGTHFTPAGNERLAEAVAEEILRRLPARTK
jgi:lysophospholipase L1-like esterase